MGIMEDFRIQIITSPVLFFATVMLIFFIGYIIGFMACLYQANQWLDDERRNKKPVNG